MILTKSRVRAKAASVRVSDFPGFFGLYSLCPREMGLESLDPINNRREFLPQTIMEIMGDPALFSTADIDNLLLDVLSLGDIQK